MHVTPIASSFSRTSGFEKRAMAKTSLSGASNRSAGALTGPCPPTKSTFWPRICRSEAEVENGLVEGSDVDRPQCREQPLIGEAGEEAVDGPLEAGDVALEA